MSAHQGNSLIAPTFLVASSAEELHRLMLQNNLKWHSQFKYTSIYEAKGKHYAWFEFDHKLLKETVRSDDK